ncbi:hypothetical protein L6452_02541 [Arctium lappa]|uniref:Uncharacterized protein n=1 Tax=Arctium lappa TaxID=4217 RepID=A0ACB9FKQ5_ARCLA|nr:hypothetical protein L6452_02541 [Arctium lappa]
MEDSNQTPLLLHQSLNAAATHGVQATGLPSTVAEYGWIDGIPAKFDELTINYCCVDVPASFYSSAGNDSVEEPNTHQLLCENDDDSVVADDLTDESVLDDEESTWPPLLSHPDRSRLYNLPSRRQNPNELCLWSRVQIITCIALLAMLWLIVYLNMVYGVQEIGTLRIGTGCSLLLKPNRFFVKTIKVEQPSDNGGPILYGFNNQPPLNVVSSWSDAQNASLESNIHKEWVYFLNEGSQINVSYSVPSSSRLFLTINRGSDGYCPWLYDQSFPNTTLSWNIIRGNGLIQQHILQSGRYHIVVENLNSEVVEVQLNMSARAFIYDTSDAYYNCTLAQGRCVIPLLFLEENHAVLTTPQQKQASIPSTGADDGQWYVKVAYGPRWSTYLGGIVVICLVASVHFWDKYGLLMVGSSTARSVAVYYSENTQGYGGFDVTLWG